MSWARTAMLATAMLAAGAASTAERAIADVLREHGAQGTERGNTGAEYRVKRPNAGCDTIGRLNEIEDLQRQGDEAAFRTALSRAMSADHCVVFTEGQRVYLMDNGTSGATPYTTSRFRLAVRVRARGEPESFWTNPGTVGLPMILDPK